MTANDQNAFTKLTHSNVTLIGLNVSISIEVAALQKIMVTLAQQVSTISTTNNNSSNSGVKKTHMYVA